VSECVLWVHASALRTLARNYAQSSHRLTEVWSGTRAPLPPPEDEEEEEEEESEESGEEEAAKGPRADPSSAVRAAAAASAAFFPLAAPPRPGPAAAMTSAAKVAVDTPVQRSPHAGSWPPSAIGSGRRAGRPGLEASRAINCSTPELHKSGAKGARKSGEGGEDMEHRHEAATAVQGTDPSVKCTLARWFMISL